MVRLKIEGVSPERCVASWSFNHFFLLLLALFHNFLNFESNLKFQFSSILFISLVAKRHIGIYLNWHFLV